MGLPTSDTTILKGSASSSSQPVPPTPKPPKKEFGSVAEEAADIIRRHKEGLAQSES